MNYYNVYAGNKHIDLIKADNEMAAMEQVERLFGEASYYVSNSKYRAVQMTLKVKEENNAILLNEDLWT